MAKITKTYSVDEKIYEAFEQVADQKNINKSSFIEGCINKYLDDNSMGFVDKVYVLKTNPNYSVTIKRQDDTFYYLNDGSKIPIILFMQMYKEVDQIDSQQFFDRASMDALNRNTEMLNQLNRSMSKTGYEGSEHLNS